ncbi:hypothetical protein NC653_030054 [Populus alba x Populus x berolinensis]|uniref:Uncharacterized protein n=1 Tax=Populus alba x Populus x berolinensis TaxID=444605 RepID=A0AAD6M3M6_9ROSI|nr:hypothetical protein NC653_030054 [Populus alba x Populus x berolinensis]
MKKNQPNGNDKSQNHHKGKELQKSRLIETLDETFPKVAITSSCMLLKTSRIFTLYRSPGQSCIDGFRNLNEFANHFSSKVEGGREAKMSHLTSNQFR